jgi:putative ABC transport system permease protein
MKITDIIRTANRNMLQSKLRSALTIIAIFVGALTLTLTTGIGNGISSYIDRQLGNLGAENTLIISGKFSESNNPLDAAKPQPYNPESQKEVSTFGGPAVPLLTATDFSKINAIENLSDAEPIRFVTIEYIAAVDGQRYTLSLGDYIDGMNLDIAAGAGLIKDTDELQVVLPEDYIEILGYADAATIVGQTVTIAAKNASGEIKEFEVHIRGILQKNILASDGAKINAPLLETLYDYVNDGLPEESRNRFFAATAELADDLTEEQITAVKDELSELGYQGQTINDQIGIVRDVINGIIMVFNVFAGIALIAASFGVINTLLMAVQERTKEIGLMKAVGMSGRGIFLLFSTEAILLGFWGSLLGALAAIGIGSLASSYASENFLQAFTGLQLLEFPIMSVLGVMLLIMTITFLAGTLPARRASKLHPIEALRYE